MNPGSNRRWADWIFIGVTIGLIFGCDRPARSRPSQPAELTLIYTNDNQGEVIDCGCPHHPLGGLARRAKYVEGIKTANRPVLQVDAGNGFFAFLSPNALSSPADQEKAKVIARSLERMDLDAINVGSMDLGSGLEFLLKDLAGSFSLPIVSSNLFDKQKQEFPFPRQLILDRAGLRIGVFGLIQEVPAFAAANLEVRDPQKTAQEMVQQLRGKCDLVIGLANLEFNQAADLARKVPGIDIIVVSRGGRTTPQPFLAESTLVVQAGSRGKYLGRMDLTMTPGGHDAQAFKQRQELSREQERLQTQLKILEGRQTQADPQVKAKFDELTRQEAEVAKRLSEIRGGFKNTNSMVAVELSLPEDPEIAKWVAAVAPPSPTAPPPIPQ